MDGVLVIDKPVGPTSHDVVARVRRALGERRIGHTGTLDPAASGVLPLVVGRATRLAQFLSARDKSYDAVIRLGSSTDTGDAQGHAVGVPQADALPSREAIEDALEAFRGTLPAAAARVFGETDRRHTQLQTGAGTSARHPARTHRARRTPHPASSTKHRARCFQPRCASPRMRSTCSDLDGDTVTLRVDCSAGFYVRSLAHDLGVRLGTGAHLAGLRRTRSGDFTLQRQRRPGRARARSRRRADPASSRWRGCSAGSRRWC